MRKQLTLSAIAMLSCVAFSQTIPTTAKTSAEQYIRQVQSRKGFVNVMLAGDSIMAGTNNDMGLRLPILLGLKAHGIEPNPVGDRTDSSAGARWLYNAFDGGTIVQAHGSIRTAELVNGFLSGSTFQGGGTASYTLTSLAKSLATNKPDIMFLCIGTNDTTNSKASYDALLAVCKAYNPQMPVIWYSPLDSTSTSTWFVNLDTSRQTNRSEIRAAILGDAGRNNIFVNSAQTLGLFASYPIDGTGYLPTSTDSVTNDTVTFGFDKGWVTGQEIVPSSTAGGLTGGTTYYLIRQATAATFAFATSFANALAGTKIDITASLNLVTFTPNTVQADQIVANGIFTDSTHLRHPGWSLVASGGLAALFGTSPEDEMNALVLAQPYQAIDFGDTGQDIASGSSAIMIPGGPYKRCLTDLTVYNSDAAVTATVTVYKRRVSQDGTTLGHDIAWKTFKVPSGVTVGWTWAFDNDPTKRTCPTAHYNEGWKVAISGAPCNVRMGGKSVVY